MVDTQPSPPRTFPDPPSGLEREQTGRLLLASAVVVLTLSLQAVWTSAAQPGWVALSGLSLFAVSLVMALLVQGGRPRALQLVGAGALATAVGFVLHADLFPVDSVIRRLLALATATMAAVCLGTWAARGIRSSADWLTVILCAAVGDAWFTVLGVTDGLGAAHPMGWLRMAGFVDGQGRLTPVFTDLFFGALYLEAGRRLGLRVSLQVFGALAGFAGAQVVSLTTWQAMPVLPLVGLGVLVGAWSDLRCAPREVMKGLMVALLFFSFLLGTVFVRRVLHPAPQRRPELFLPRDVASTAVKWGPYGRQERIHSA